MADAATAPAGPPAARVRPEAWLALAWAMGALAILAMEWIERLPMANGGRQAELSDTYYVLVHDAYVRRLALMCIVVAGFYYGLARFAGFTFSRLLGWTHFALSFGGIVLSLGAMLAMRVFFLPVRFDDYGEAFARLNLVSTIGGWAAVAGGVVFIVALIDAARRTGG